MRIDRETATQHAIRYIRGEGYTVRPLGGGSWLVKQGDFRRQMTDPDLLAFAGVKAT